MSGQTKLFQRAGSPLIQGHSRYERPFWTEWALACLPAALSIYAALGLATLVGWSGTDVAALDSASSILSWLARPAAGIAAMLPSCALGVALARRMGWRRAWLAGASVGAAVGIAVMLYSWNVV